MLTRSFSLAVILCLAASLAAFGQCPSGNQGQEYLFQFSAPPSTSTLFAGYTDAGNLQTPQFSVNGPAGIAAIVPTPDGTKFYMAGTSGATALESSDCNFTTGSIQALSGLGAAPNAMTVTPDGKYLLVAADAFYVFSTSTNANLTTGGLPMTGSATFTSGTPGSSVCMSCWIAVSRDSQFAYVLTNSNFSSVLTKYNLTTLTKVGSLSLGAGATSLTLSPLGQLYAEIEFNIYVVDPVAFTLNTSNNISIPFEGGPLRYTPDGSTAYVANKSAASGGGSMAQINLATGGVLTWPAISNLSPPQIDDIFPVSTTRVLGFSSSLAAMIDITPNPFGATIPSTSLGLPANVVSSEVLAAAASNELPTAHWLFLLIANGNQTDLYRVDLTTNTLSSNTLSTFNSGVMSTKYVPASTGAANFIQFNNNQALQNNSTSLPLIIHGLELDRSSGVPVKPVTFSTDTTTDALVINTPSPTSNAQGFAQTTVSVPTAGASCPSKAFARSR